MVREIGPASIGRGAVSTSVIAELKSLVIWAGLAGFLPGLAAGRPFPLPPAVVSDPTDPKLVHLDGLNLTRAWTLSAAARALPASDGRRKVLESAAAEHSLAGLARVSSGSYEGEHWLASFAVYLLTDAGTPAAPTR